MQAPSWQDFCVRCLVLCGPRHPFRASLRSRNAHGHFARAILRGNLKGKCQTLMPAQSKCTWTFHKNHFVWKFTGKMPDATDTTSIKHGALTIAVRTPQCGHTVWGIAGNMQETLDYKSPSIQVNSSNFWLAQDITNHNFKMPAFLGSAPQNFSPESKATGLQVWDKLDMCVLERACWCHCRVQGTVRVPCALWTAVGVLCVPAGGR